MSDRIDQINSFKKVLYRRKRTEPMLEYIYAEQMAFARFHNGLMWQVSTIFVPFSLAGLALTFGNEAGELNTPQLWFVTIGSIIMVVAWTCLAEWHRWLWVHSFHLAKVVEAKWGYREKLEPPRRADIIHPLSKPPSFLGVDAHRSDLGRIIRVSIAGFIIIIWIARLVIGLRTGG